MPSDKMPDTRLAIERLRWMGDSYTHDDRPTYAYLDQRLIANVVDCPAGWALRLYCIPFGQPSWNEVYETHESAMQAVADWVRGLDIDPGPDVMP